MLLRLRDQSAGGFRRGAAGQPRGIVRRQGQRPLRTAQALRVSAGLGVQARQCRQQRGVVLRALLQCRKLRARLRSMTAQQQGFDQLERRGHVVRLEAHRLLRGREHRVVTLQPLLGECQQQPRLGQLRLLRQQGERRAARGRQAPGLNEPLGLAEQGADAAAMAR